MLQTDYLPRVKLVLIPAFSNDLFLNILTSVKKYRGNIMTIAAFYVVRKEECTLVICHSLLHVRMLSNSVYNVLPNSSVCPSVCTVCVKTAKHHRRNSSTARTSRETRFLRIKRRYKVRRVTVSEAGYKKFTILGQLVAVTTSRQTRLTLSYDTIR